VARRGTGEAERDRSRQSGEVTSVRKTTVGRPADRIASALEDAVDLGRLAPSVHNTQPWTFVLFADRMELRADRSRQLSVLDPEGRELVESVGAALFNVRCALAARGFAAVVERLPRPADPDLLAVVRPVDGEPDPVLARLARAIPRRHTNRRPFGPATVPDEVVERLTEATAAEGALLVAVRRPEQRALIGELTQEADRLQNTDPAYREELRTWTSRTPAQGDGVPLSSVPLTTGVRPDALPLRDFDTRGTGGLPARTGSGTDQTLLLVATEQDDPAAWLRSGEALERLLLELTRGEWVAGPITQPLEVPATRVRLGELTAPAHPQMLLRIGRAAPAPGTPRRPRRTVVENSTQRVPEPHPSAQVPGRPPTEPRSRPVSDGRGGTTWI
jgi:nitroreductase